MKKLKSVSQFFMVMAVSAVFLLFLNSCSKEGFYKGMYHGLQQREEMVHPSDDPLPTEQPSYETYQREREEALLP